MHWQGAASPSFTGGFPQLQLTATSSDQYSRYIFALFARVQPVLTDAFRSSYRLEIVQHPLKAAEFGSSTLTRLAVAPPLIAQLYLHDRSSPDDIE